MEINKKKIALIGVPWDQKSSYLQGPALAPQRIRSVLHSGAGNNWTELTVNPIEHELFEDWGDMVIKKYFDIEKQIASSLNKGVRLIINFFLHSIFYK